MPEMRAVLQKPHYRLGRLRAELGDLGVDTYMADAALPPPPLCRVSAAGPRSSASRISRITKARLQPAERRPRTLVRAGHRRIGSHPGCRRSFICNICSIADPHRASHAWHVETIIPHEARPVRRTPDRRHARDASIGCGAAGQPVNVQSGERASMILRNSRWAASPDRAATPLYRRQPVFHASRRSSARFGAARPRDVLVVTSAANNQKLSFAAEAGTPFKFVERVTRRRDAARLLAALGPDGSPDIAVVMHGMQIQGRSGPGPMRCGPARLFRDAADMQFEMVCDDSARR